jgi:hypothetical protein
MFEIPVASHAERAALCFSASRSLKKSTVYAPVPTLMTICLQVHVQLSQQRCIGEHSANIDGLDSSTTTYRRVSPGSSVVCFGNCCPGSLKMSTTSISSPMGQGQNQLPTRIRRQYLCKQAKACCHVHEPSMCPLASRRASTLTPAPLETRDPPPAPSIACAVVGKICHSMLTAAWPGHHPRLSFCLGRAGKKCKPADCGQLGRRTGPPARSQRDGCCVSACRIAN